MQFLTLQSLQFTLETSLKSRGSNYIGIRVGFLAVIEATSLLGY